MIEQEQELGKEINKHHVTEFSWGFLHPRYWLLWLWFGFLWSVTRLPYPLVYRIGRGLGLLSLRLLPKRRVIAERNIELCFPEKTLSERDQIVRESFAGGGLTIIESGLLWWPSKNLFDRLEMKGMEHIERLRAEGKPVLVFGLHNTPMEIAAASISLYVPFNGLMRVNDNPCWEYVANRCRGRYNLRILPRKQVKELLNYMQQGEVGLMLPDQDFGRRRSVFVPFFGIPTATVPSVSDFSQQANAAVIFMNFYRKGSKGYCVELSEPLKDFPSGDLVADTARVSLITEEAVRQRPGEYLWQHRRFKTRPEGEPSLY